jgi:hypothetical protein
MAARIRDVFRGWQVSLRLTGNEWWVSLLDNEGTPVMGQSCVTAEAAVALCVSWMALISDCREVVGDCEDAMLLVRTLLQSAVSEMEIGPDDAEPDLEDWFRRQWMSDS